MPSGKKDCLGVTIITFLILSGVAPSNARCETSVYETLKNVAEQLLGEEIFHFRGQVSSTGVPESFQGSVANDPDVVLEGKQLACKLLAQCGLPDAALAAAAKATLLPLAAISETNSEGSSSSMIALGLCFATSLLLNVGLGYMLYKYRVMLTTYKRELKKEIKRNVVPTPGVCRLVLLCCCRCCWRT